MKARHLFRIMVIFTLLTGKIAHAQVSPNIDPAYYTAKVVDLSNKDSVFELLKLYKDSANYLEGQMRLYAKIVMYNTFNRPDELIQDIDSMFTHYSVESPSGYQYIKAETLLQQGQYKELAAFCESAEKDSLLKMHPGYQRFEYLAKQLSDTPNSFVDFPKGECVIPTSRYFPLRLSARINGVEMLNAILDTGAPFTLLSRKTAEACQVHFLGDTVIANSCFGNVKTTTGIVKELRVGDVVFHNINVQVATSDAPDFFVQNDILGMQEFRRLSSVTFSLGKLTLRKNTRKKDLNPNMRFKDGHIYLYSVANGRTESFMLDTGADCNYNYTSDSIPSGSVTELPVSGNPIQFITAAQNNIAGQCSGQLGLPYFINRDSCTLDFEQMRFTGSDYHRRPLNYPICINSGDFMNLAAHRKWYESTSDEMGRYLIGTYLGYAQNQPEECFQFTDSLLSKCQQQLGNSFINIVNLRAVALALMGNFTAAIELLQQCVQAAPHLQGIINKCQALQNAGEQRIEWQAPVTTLPAKPVDGGLLLSAIINQQKSPLHFIPEKTQCQISSQDAARYQMRIVEYEEDSIQGKKKIAIADNITLGKMNARNVQFEIDETVNGIYLGNNFLRLIPQYTLEKQRVTFSSQSTPPAKDTTVYPLLMVNYILCYYSQNGNDIKSYAIGNPYPATEKVQLKELLEKNKIIKIDSRNMYLQLSK